jgi:hypothetical protein
MTRPERVTDPKERAALGVDSSRDYLGNIPGELDKLYRHIDGTPLSRFKSKLFISYSSFSTLY